MVSVRLIRKKEMKTRKHGRHLLAMQLPTSCNKTVTGNTKECHKLNE